MNHSCTKTLSDAHHNRKNHHVDMLKESSVTMEHDHGVTSGHHSMMQMFFHTGFTETILFKSWTTTSIPIFICSCALIFVLGILYEGIRELRRSLEEERFIKRSNSLNGTNALELERINIELHEAARQTTSKVPLDCRKHVLHSLLYVIQLILSYVLMLIAMTFNVYIFLVIIFGVGTGHILYQWACKLRPNYSSDIRHKIEAHSHL